MNAKLKKTSHGFTLVELLVSMMITTIIIAVLVTVTVTSLNMWNRSRAEVRASLQAKAMIDSMAADFESMVIRRGNNFQWFFADFKPPTDGPNNNENLSPSALDLIFFSAATDRYEGKVGDPAFPGADEGGDISSIGYKLIYKNPIGNDNIEKYKTFILYRKLVNPDETFQSLLGQTNLKTAFDGTSGSIEEIQNFVCENIYQFNVKFHMSVVVANVTSNVAVTLDQNNNQFVITGNGITTGGAAAVLQTGRLTAVEISLSVLTDFGLKQMQGRSFNNQQRSEFISKNSYQYSKLISVPSY